MNAMCLSLSESSTSTYGTFACPLLIMNWLSPSSTNRRSWGIPYRRLDQHRLEDASAKTNALLCAMTCVQNGHSLRGSPNVSSRKVQVIPPRVIGPAKYLPASPCGRRSINPLPQDGAFFVPETNALVFDPEHAENCTNDTEGKLVPPA